MTYRVSLCFLATTLLITASVRLAMAQGSCCEAPIITDEITVSPDWSEWPEWHGKLEIRLEKETIARNEGIDLWCVVEGGAPCPPFNWTVSGTGFRFGNISGPTTGQTDEEFEIIQLWADNTACGSATITVTDACGKNVMATVRCTSAGRWVVIENYNCGNVNYWPGGCFCTRSFICTVGAFRYTDTWAGGTNMNYQWPPEERVCAPYACNPTKEDLNPNRCSCPGFHFPFGLVGVRSKKIEQWICN